MGDYGGAARFYTEALEWLPDESTLYCNRSAAFFQLGEMKKALRDAFKAAKISPRYLKAHYRCALAQSELGNHKKALAEMRRAQDLSLSSGECGQALAKIEGACSRAHLHRNLTGHSDRVQDLAWRPLSSSGAGSGHCLRPLLATAGLDGAVKIWCADTGILLHSFGDHQDKVTWVMWTSDGLDLVSLSVDRSVRVWKVSGDGGKAECARVLLGHQGRATSACFAVGGGGERLLVTSSTDATARVWDLSSPSGTAGTVLRGHGEMVTWVAASPGGRRIATASADKTFKVWDLETKECAQTVDWDSGAVTRCAFVSLGPERSEILVTCHFDVKRERSRILGWSMDGARGWADGKLVAHVMHYDDFGGKVTCLDWAEVGDGEGSVMLAAGCGDGAVRVMDLSCDFTLYDLVDQHLPSVGTSASVTALAFSPGGAMLATAGVDGRIHIWQGEDGAHLMTFVCGGHSERVACLRWSDDGGRLASGSGDGAAKIWDTGSLLL